MLLALAVINAIVTLVFNPWSRPCGSRSRAGDRPGRDRRRALGGVASLVFGEQHRRAVDRRGGRARLRAAGHARQRVRGPGDPDRAAVPRRPLDSRRPTSRAASSRSPGARRRSARRPATSSSCRTTSSRRRRSPTTRSRRRRRGCTSRSARPMRRRRTRCATRSWRRWRSAARAATPPPDVLLADFGGVGDHVPRAVLDRRLRARRRARATRCARAIYYEFHRRGIEIPWPIQVEYARDETAARSRRRAAGRWPGDRERARVLAALPTDAHRALAAGRASGCSPTAK